MRKIFLAVVLVAAVGGCTWPEVEQGAMDVQGVTSKVELVGNAVGPYTGGWGNLVGALAGAVVPKQQRQATQLDGRRLDKRAIAFQMYRSNRHGFTISAIRTGLPVATTYSLPKCTELTRTLPTHEVTHSCFRPPLGRTRENKQPWKHRTVMFGKTIDRAANSKWQRDRNPR